MLRKAVLNEIEDRASDLVELSSWPNVETLRTTFRERASILKVKVPRTTTGLTIIK
jgi:hypothetical protein